MNPDANPFFSRTISDIKPVFSIAEVRVKEWINKIPKPDLKVSGMTRVCIKHFDDKDIKRSDIFKCRNGNPDIIVCIYRILCFSDQY